MAGACRRGGLPCGERDEHKPEPPAHVVRAAGRVRAVSRLHEVDAVGDPPPDWGADNYFDPDSTANDRVYCRRGGWLGELARFDPLAHKVMPTSIDGGEPDQFLALEVASRALDDAGLLFLVLERFKNIDLHPDKVSNLEMGYIFGEEKGSGVVLPPSAEFARRRRCRRLAL